MRIIVFGGSFNPVHTGHALMASVVAQLKDVDEVWMMVSPQNPLKNESGLMPENERLKLVKLVAANTPGVVASDFEFHLERPSFTYKTLCSLLKRYPQHEFRILIGSDNWNDFYRWRDHDKIIEEFGVVIYERPGYEVKGSLPGNVTLLKDVPMMMVSSTYIRRAIKEGKDIRYMVPDVVYKEIIGK